MKKIKHIGLFILTAITMNASFAQMEKTVMLGGAAMYPSKNIVQNAVNSKDHTTLVAAVKAPPGLPLKEFGATGSSLSQENIPEKTRAIVINLIVRNIV